MTDTNLDQGNFYVTNGTLSGDIITTTGNQKVVEIQITGNLEYDSQGEFVDIPVAIPSGEQPLSGGTEEPLRHIFNLLQVKQSITVKGVLLDDATRSDGVSTSALDKKSDMLTLRNYGGGLIIVWGLSAQSTQQKFDGTDTNQNKAFIWKMRVREVTSSYHDSAATVKLEKGFEIEVSFLIGSSTAE